MERPERALLPLAATLLSLIIGLAPDVCEATDAVEDALRARDYVSAYDLLEPAAASGDAEACFRLASLHLRRDGTTYDPAKAFQWMSAAAEKGHVAARYSLGVMYEKGDGVEADPLRAKAWLLSAAVAGHQLAARKLDTIDAATSEREAIARSRATDTSTGAPSPILPLPTPALEGPYASWPALSVAAWRGDTELVRSLLSRGATVNARDAGGITPLARAVDAGHVDVVRVLLAAGAKPAPSKPVIGLPGILNGPAARGNVEMISLLVDAGADVDPAFEPTPLTVAACAGHTDAVQWLLAAGASPDHRVRDGIKPLACAARENHSGAVRVLLAANARMDSRDSAGRSAIRFGAERGSDTALRLLVDAGADVDAADRNGVSPLAAAAGAGNENSVALLLAAGADTAIASDLGNSALHAACAYPAIVRRLLGAGIDKNARNQEGNTPLMVAARLGSSDTVEVLLASGADRRLRNRRGENAASYARATGHEDLARRIERRTPARVGVAALH